MDRRNRPSYRPQLDVLEDRLPPGGLRPGSGLADLAADQRRDLLDTVTALAAAQIASVSSGVPAILSVFPINSHPYGMSYGQWSAAWWQWATSLPADHHPLFDTADLSAGQSGHVWFLGGTFFLSGPPGGNLAGVADRSGTVPAGTALFFPILNSEASTAEGNGTTEAELRAAATAGLGSPTILEADIDGHPIRNLFAYRAQSPLFTYGPVPNNNIFQALGENVPAGTVSQSASDGYYLMLRPLQPGHHTIHFSFTTVVGQQADGSPLTASEDITYHLTVVPGHGM